MGTPGAGHLTCTFRCSVLVLLYVLIAVAVVVAFVGAMFYFTVAGNIAQDVQLMDEGQPPKDDPV